MVLKCSFGIQDDLINKQQKVMKQFHMGTSKRKYERDIKASNCRSDIIPLQSLSLQSTARTLVKKYKCLKDLESSVKNEHKLSKIYRSLIGIVHQLLTDTFEQDLSKQLIQMLNKLVYGYESDYYYDEKQKIDKQNCYELKSLEQSLTSRKSTPKNIIPNLNIKLDQEQKELKKEKRLRIFVLHQLKISFNEFKEEKIKLNQEIKTANERIATAFQQMDRKIKNVQLQRIIFSNKQRLALESKQVQTNQQLFQKS